MIRSLLLSALVLLLACTPVDLARRPGPVAAARPGPLVIPRDPHAHANTEAFRTRHLVLDLTVDFNRRRLSGSAELQLKRLDAAADTLVLDTRDLDIERVEAGVAGALQPAAFTLGARDPVLGSALRIALPPPADTVRVHYATRPEASGLQWLSAAQTADRKHPFLFTQSQAIHARSWIPLQDTPQVRATYEARIRTPRPLLAVMSAEMEQDPKRGGDYRFHMPQAIPSYLIALAVGDLRFRAMGPRTGIYAEPSMVKRAAREFADTEQMMERCEAIFGPYRWGRYDLLILPPSFPYGGMENPRLTFATPTVVAGDKSLVSLVAHELAHSWSGNLVTNATWSDFWLNEGFTNHLTYRIMEELYGTDRGVQERALGANDLKETLQRLDAEDAKTLSPRQAPHDPDDNVTDVPYEKGALFLAYLEDRFGREAFDAFLRGWFDRHAFQSVTTPQFLDDLDRELLRRRPGTVSAAEVREWVYAPGMPADTVWPQSDAFAAVDAARADWLEDRSAARALPVAGWSLRQWQYFLDALPPLDAERLAELDAAFNLTRGSNPVLAARWFRVVAQNGYAPAYPAMERHLGSIGRMLLITPVYRELAKSEAGLALARRIYAQARPGYHPIAQDAVQKILDAAAATPPAG